MRICRHAPSSISLRAALRAGGNLHGDNKQRITLCYIDAVVLTRANIRRGSRVLDLCTADLATLAKRPKPVSLGTCSGLASLQVA